MKIFMLLGMALCLCSCRYGINFHEVDPGLYYRSAQLTPEEFQMAIEKAGIKTIVNLRGAAPGKKWYDDEIAIAKANGVQHIDIAMTASHIPEKETLIQVLDTLAAAPRPLLIHCLQGADRTGEVTALYEMLYMNKTKEEALKALSVKTYHNPILFPAMRYFIKIWQGENWARTEYDPCVQDYQHFNQAKLCHSNVTTPSEDYIDASEEP